MSEEQLNQFIDKLDQVKLELLRLRSLLVPEEELTPDEKRALEKSRREFENGKYVALEDVLKEFG